MSSDTVIYRFAADKEYRLSEEKLGVGDVIQRNGEDWVVASVAEVQDGTTVVTLRPGRELASPSIVRQALLGVTPT